MYRSNKAMHALFSSKELDADLILIQEPWWGRISQNGAEGSVSTPKYSPIIPINPIPQETRPRVMAYVKKGRNDFTITLRTDLLASLDAQILEVKQGHTHPTLIANIYNPPANSDTSEFVVDEILKVRWPPRIATILTGDWNLHQYMWEPAKTNNPTSRAEEVAEWLDGAGFSMANEPDVPTFVSRDGKSSSTIDLTFLNETAVVNNTMREWTVDWNMSFTSDHAAIRWIMGQAGQAVDTSPHARFNYKEAKWSDFAIALTDEVVKHRDSFDRLQTTEPIGEEVIEEAARQMMECMQQAVEKAVPLRRNSPHSKEFWDQNLTNLLRRARELRTEIRDLAKEGITPSPQQVKEAVHAERVFKRTVAKTRNEHFASQLEEATNKDVFGYRKWTQGRREYPSPSFPRVNAPPAVTHEDKCDYLREALFPPPPDAHDAMPDLTAAHPDDKPWTPVKRSQVRNAIFRPDPKKAPGPSGITFEALRWAWGIIEDDIFYLIAACVNNGYHPKVWKSTISVALRKPGKDRYDVAKSWRMIALEEALSKATEGTFAECVKSIACSYGLIPRNQFGGVPKRSTEDAAMTFLHDVECAWNHGYVTTALTFDISGAFDHVSHPHLLRIMREKRFPLHLVKWTRSFLSERETAVCLDGKIAAMKPVRTGIPQGSPASPILFILFSSPIEEVVKRRFEQDNWRVEPSLTTPKSLTFVDDGKVYVSSPNPEQNVIVISQAWQAIEEWGTAVGVKFDRNKKELMHYCRGRKRTFDELPPVTLSTPRDPQNTQELLPRKWVKWLGFILDWKLTFFEHVQTLATKATKALGALKMLANTRKGIHQTLARTLYISCIRPILTYGSVVWWRGNDERGRKRHLTILEKVQNKALRWVCGAFKTTPTRAIHNETAILPIKHHLEWIQDKYAIRMNTLDLTHPTLQRLEPGWRLGYRPLDPPPLPPRKATSRTDTKSTHLLKVAKRSNPAWERLFPFEVEPWRRTEEDEDLKGRIQVTGPRPLEPKEDAASRHRAEIKKYLADPEHLLIYTDGSQMLMGDHGRYATGAGIVGYCQGDVLFERSIGMGGSEEVYDAELEGLAAAAEFVRDQILAEPDFWQVRPKIIHFFCDNSAAVGYILTGKAQAGQWRSKRFRKAIFDMLDADPEKQVEVAWVPGHQDVKGNERSDDKAKEGTRRRGTSWTSLTWARRKAKKKALDAWRKEWMMTPPQGGYALADRFLPKLQPPRHFRNLSRPIYAKVFQCRTNHAFIGEYYRRFVPSESTECLCGEEVQSREHILRECLFESRYRHFLREEVPDLNLADILGTIEGIDALASFIQHSGAFTKR